MLLFIMKRRVLSFFTVLLMLAIVLSLIQFVNMGNIGSFAILKDIAGNSRIPNVYFNNTEGVIFSLVILVFVFIAALIVTKLEKHREKAHLHLVSDKQPFTRKLIPISYD